MDSRRVCPCNQEFSLIRNKQNTLGYTDLTIKQDKKEPDACANTKQAVKIKDVAS